MVAVQSYDTLARLVTCDPAGQLPAEASAGVEFARIVATTVLEVFEVHTVGHLQPPLALGPQFWSEGVVVEPPS